MPNCDKPLNILLAEDDDGDAKAVQRSFLKAKIGNPIVRAVDGRDALDMITADPGAYDIVISDHHMTVMNGLELVMKLREIKYKGMIAIVSSELNEDVADDYRKLGINHILFKPVSLSDLRALVLESDNYLAGARA